ncbi:hypothetical protein [Actinoplanes flavus]|uniref:Lipoprotein n=1 Tax=Actinoplanes flavus TaxID=2820290 RepID=A0ABS3UX57_9ACTN|nr:hypothetical protein [Actinoplanes flavus]MBO3743144.1 hypothetical protein [Actinoplanes flavus]
MRGVLIPSLVLTALLPTASCGSSPDSAPPPPPPAPPSAPVTSSPVPGGSAPAPVHNPALAGLFTSAQACEVADGAYSTLDTEPQRHIRDGVAAERRGDKAAVARSLEALRPLFYGLAATFSDAAAKVTDPALQAALDELAAAAEKETTFTTFAEFDQMQGLTAPAEAVLKLQCSRAGYTLKNLT